MLSKKYINRVKKELILIRKKCKEDEEPQGDLNNMRLKVLWYSKYCIPQLLDLVDLLLEELEIYREVNRDEPNEE